MFRLKKWLSETFCSCMNPAKQVEPRIILECAIYAEDVWLPVPSSNKPSLQVCIDTDRNNEEEEFASFRHFIINKESEKPQQDEEAHQPEDEEFTFCSLLKQSDEQYPAMGFSFDSKSANPTTVRENLSLSMNDEEDKEEEDTDYEDEEDTFECAYVQMDIANRRKQYIEESACLNDLKISQESLNQANKEDIVEDDEFSLLQKDILENGRIKFDGISRSRCISMDESENHAEKEFAEEIPKIVEDEYSLLQKEILQKGRIKFDGRRSTSRNISMDESVASSSARSSSQQQQQQQKKKVTFIIQDCCSVPHRIRTADILYCKILRALRFRSRSFKFASSRAHGNAGILKKNHVQRNVADPTLMTFLNLY